jgi:hypothetical protein
MEFLEGESLRQALTRRGALPVPEVAEILQQTPPLRGDSDKPGWYTGADRKVGRNDLESP